MGSRSRKRRVYARLASEAIGRVAASETPRVAVVQELSALRMRGENKPRKPKPSHVLAKESAGHQYVGGSRARGVSLTSAERAQNKRDREQRNRPFRSQGADRVDRGRGNSSWITAGREIDSRDLTTVESAQGAVKRLTVAEKRERAMNGM